MARVRSRLYRPRHVPETIRHAGKLISCTEASLEMFIDASTLGGVRISQHEIRAMSDEPKPDPRSPGLNLTQVGAVAAQLRVPFYDRTRSPWSKLVAWLEEGRCALVQLDNFELGDCQRSRVGHAMLLRAIGPRGVLGYNPLCDRPKRYDPATVQRAMRKFARATGVDAGLRFAVSRRIPRIAVRA